jgi:hypothetical protein
MRVRVSKRVKAQESRAESFESKKPLMHPSSENKSECCRMMEGPEPYGYIYIGENSECPAAPPREKLQQRTRSVIFVFNYAWTLPWMLLSTEVMHVVHDWEHFRINLSLPQCTMRTFPARYIRWNHDNMYYHYRYRMIEPTDCAAQLYSQHLYWHLQRFRKISTSKNAFLKVKSAFYYFVPCDFFPNI